MKTIKWKSKEDNFYNSVKGIAFEFLGLNLTGFLFLSAYSSAGYFKGGGEDNGKWPFTGDIAI